MNDLPPGATPVTEEQIAEAQGNKGRELRSLDEESLDAVTSVKNSGQQLIDQISALGSSRELSLARTKAEEAVMWAVKHITA